MPDVGGSDAIIKPCRAGAASHAGALPAMVTRKGSGAAAAACLLATAACTAAPNLDALIELHEQAVTLHRPATYPTNERRRARPQRRKKYFRSPEFALKVRRA